MTLLNIFLIIAGLSALVIVFVVLRKFPTVAGLDLKNFGEEKEAKKKKELIEGMLMNKSEETRKALEKKFSPLKKIWGALQLKFRIYVGKIEKLLHYEELLKSRQTTKKVPLAQKVEELLDLINRAGNFFNEGNYEKAEELYIAAIKIDKKSVSAYRGLADTYAAQGSIEEALETYDFLTRLSPGDDALLIKLSELSEERGQINQAINYLERAVAINDSLAARYYKLAELYGKAEQKELSLEAVSQAVELEPKNPKFLDLLIENAIMCGKRDLAEKTFEELRLVNPENQKLAELKEKIESLEKKRDE